MKSFILASVAVAIAAMTGCVNYLPIALGSGPEAEDAVQHLYSSDSLMQVITAGNDQKVREIAAQRLVGQIGTWGQLRDVVCEEAYEKIPVLRVAAMKQLVKTGNGKYVLEREDVATAVATGKVWDRAKGKIKLDGEVANFPSEYRIKAIQYGSVPEKMLSYLARSKNEDLAIRKAAMNRIKYMDPQTLAVILDDAADASKSDRNASMEVFKSWFSEDASVTGGDSQNDNSRKLDVLVNVVWANPKGNCVCKASPQARKLAYSLITTDEKKADALKHAVWTVERHESDENTSLVKELIAATDNEAVLEDFVDNPGTVKDKILPYLKMALERINDEKFIIKNVLEQRNLFEDDQTFLLESVNKVKDPAAREEWRDKIVAKYSKDNKERRSAFARICDRNVHEAFQMTYGWSAEELASVSDQKILIRLLKIHGEETKNDWPRIQQATLATLQKALLKIVIAKEKALTQDEREKLVAAQVEKAKKLSAEGKTLVVGNCYVGMPLIGLLALNGCQEFKVVPSDWDANDAGDAVVVKSISLSSKDLYKATGLEKADVRFKFPTKFGVSAFKTGMTKMTYERNEIAEYLGDYNSGKFSGGDIYYESESQAKGVKVLFWKDSGNLVMSKLED